MEAFAAAVERGFGYLELDVHTTRDGVVVVFHDEELERVSDGRGAVADHDHADIAALRVSGRRIPCFEDVLAAWSDVRLNVDIKDEASVGPFAALVNKYAAHDRVLVASFSDARRHRVLRLLDAPAASSPGLVTSALAVLLGKVGCSRCCARGFAGSPPCRFPNARGDCAWSPRVSWPRPTGQESTCMCGWSTTVRIWTGCWIWVWMG